MIKDDYLNEITQLMDSPSKEDIEFVTKAYQFAAEAHRDHKRYSGEPYIVHLVETAKIIAELRKGPVAVSAGLLHDSIEDVGIKPEDIEKNFGRETLFLVESVTKLGQLRYRGTERHIDSMRKLFIAMVEDIRVLIIKLADRLHNMRTLQFVPEEKRERIALETLEIYAPLAYRMGIRKISRELEDLAFQYVAPEQYAEIKKLVKERGKEKLANVEKFQKSVVKALAKEKIIDIKTDYRIKNHYSLYQKLIRRNNDIEKIYDIAALRVIVPTVEDCYRVLGVIHGNWRPLPGRIKDYIAFPRPNGYRSLHTTIFTGDGGIVEIQIRTEEMHDEAEYGISSHIAYRNIQLKESKFFDAISWFKKIIPTFNKKNLPVRDIKTIANFSVPKWVRELAESDAGHANKDDFLNSLKSDFFEYRVFTFTPKGDVVDLPVDSSPIDFAYAVHTELGNQMSGAKVNGKLVSLDTKLKNGDIVEIQTKKSSRPTKKWLDIVKTSLARKQIRVITETSSTAKKRK